MLDETDSTGSTTNAALAKYVYFDGERVARRDSQNNVLYYFEDQVNSSRAIVELASGSGTPALCYDADFYPYGGEDVFTNTCSQNYKFQGKERDPETGNDYFGARFYSSTYGRFLSPDWSSVPAPVPYANLTNPQTLNLYAMVSDNPESFADLDGHGTGCTSTGPECSFILGYVTACGSLADAQSAWAGRQQAAQSTALPQQQAQQQNTNGQVQCTNANCTTATQTVVVHAKASFWDRIKSWFSGVGQQGPFPNVLLAQNTPGFREQGPGTRGLPKVKGPAKPKLDPNDTPRDPNDLLDPSTQQIYRVFKAFSEWLTGGIGGPLGPGYAPIPPVYIPPDTQCLLNPNSCVPMTYNMNTPHQTQTTVANGLVAGPSPSIYLKK